MAQRDAALAELLRIATKVRAYSSNPAACLYHIGIFYRLCLEQWFSCQREWPQPVHIALPLISAQNPEFAQLIRRLSAETIGKNSAELCDKMLEVIRGL